MKPTWKYRANQIIPRGCTPSSVTFRPPVLSLNYLLSDGVRGSIRPRCSLPLGVISSGLYVRQLLINIDIPTSEVVKCLLKVLQVDRMISLLRARANRNYSEAVKWLQFPRENTKWKQKHKLWYCDVCSHHSRKILKLSIKWSDQNFRNHTWRLYCIYRLICILLFYTPDNSNLGFYLD